MDKERVLYLVRQYREHLISADELNELWLLIEEEGNSATIKEAIEEDIFQNVYADEIEAAQLERMFANIMTIDKSQQKKALPNRPRVLRMWKWVAAASIILVIGYGLLVTGSRKSQDTGNKTQVAKGNDVPAPANTRAVITFADGSKVYLDSAGNGIVAKQNNVDVVRNASGEIVYDAKVREANADLQYNTLSNPRGSKVISLTLSDGTKVWLNSESSLKYPTQFVKNTREVEITGEAYFEVAHNASKPFHVKKGETDVTVLGTHFNVNAYDDEDALCVTLLEGSVKVTDANKSVLIRPGEQAQMNSGNAIGLVVNRDVNLDGVMAWKNGLFQFNKADVQTVMRQISRWYDVDVSYPNGIPKDQYWGAIRRDLNLSSLFKVLEESGAHFKIEGKKVIVLP